MWYLGYRVEKYPLVGYLRPTTQGRNTGVIPDKSLTFVKRRRLIRRDTSWQGVRTNAAPYLPRAPRGLHCRAAFPESGEHSPIRISQVPVSDRRGSAYPPRAPCSRRRGPREWRILRRLRPSLRLGRRRFAVDAH